MVLDLKKVFLTEGECLTVEYTLDLHELTLNGIAPLKTPVRVKALAKNEADVVSLAITADLDYDAPCDRCGEQTVTAFSFRFEHTAVCSLSGENDGEYVETPDYLLDLDELVTDDITLELPSKYLCSEECKGLCSKCGQNLNRGGCKCDLRQTDPRLEVLKKLL